MGEKRLRNYENGSVCRPKLLPWIKSLRLLCIPCKITYDLTTNGEVVGDDFSRVFCFLFFFFSLKLAE